MYSDNEIIPEIRGGSQKAFRTVYDAHYKLMLGVAINLLKDIDAAKEVVQEVFYQFWKNRENIKDGISIRNYLKRAVINRAINQIKYKSRFVGDGDLVETQSNFTNPDDDLEAKDLKAIIDKAMEKVPEKARVIFILRRHEGLSLKEIAEKLDISPKTVENQITRALKILKQEVEPYLKIMNKH